jgi:hypothetical protein
LSRKDHLTHTRAIIGDQTIEIDYLTTVRSDWLCLFYVSGPDGGKAYLAHLSNEIAGKPKRELLRYLHENLEGSRVQLIRSFPVPG